MRWTTTLCTAAVAAVVVGGAHGAQPSAPSSEPFFFGLSRLQATSLPGKAATRYRVAVSNAPVGDGPFPYRWHGSADYGPSKFGRSPVDPPSFTGRRVDLLGRSLDAPPGAEPAAAVRGWLSAARTETARQLAAKAVVLISPGHRSGEVIWPAAAPTGKA